MALELRPYQREAIDALYAYWGNGGGNGLIVIPTGGGKSLVLSMICKELLSSYPDMRIGVVTHVKELITQNAAELLSVWHQAPIGIYSAGLGKRDLRAKILFMGIQSVYNKQVRLGDFDVLIVDEAHLIPRSSDTMYGRFIADCLGAVPDMRIIGLTATPYRLDSGRLDTGDNALFEKVVYDANVRDLIGAGYLSPLISKATLARIETNGLHRRDGEFIQSEMDERARIPGVVEAAVSEFVELGKDRTGWLAFCTSVEHAEQVRDEVRKRDISCEMVVADTPNRDGIIKQFKARKIRCLTSVGVLTTGFNAPHVDMIALLRPTLSTGLYIQMVGRAFRLAQGKENALILDFAGNVMRHGPVDAISPQRAGGGSSKSKGATEEDDTVKAKQCPQCRALVEPSTRICLCGFEWPAPPPRHEARAAENVPILTTEAAKPAEVEVESVSFSKHEKMGSFSTMRVTYHSEIRDYSQWICFEHDGKPKDRARMWWRKIGGQMPVPTTVDDAVARAPDELDRISAIIVKQTDRYPEVVSVKTIPGRNVIKPSAYQLSSRNMVLDDDIPF